jgi:hypothetical protein
MVACGAESKAAAVIVLRILGALLILAAVAALAREAVGYFSDRTWSFMPLGELWAWVHTPSLGLLEAAIVRYLSEDLWYDWIFPVLEAPAWVVFGVPGLVLLALSFAFRRRRHRRAFPRSRGEA